MSSPLFIGSSAASARRGSRFAGVVLAIGALLVAGMSWPVAAWAVDDTSISGTIRYANDSVPVAGAEVEAFDASGDGSEPVATTVADADGAYSLTGLPSGTYRLRAAGDPALYVPQWYSGQLTFADAFDTVLDPGTNATNLDFYLLDAQDSISGTIRYANDSEPIAGATVEFYDASGAGVTPAATVTSGADGSYVVQNLPYGTYRVRAVADPALYVPQWFSGQSAFVDAFDVVIGAGSHVPSVDVYLADAQDSISGTIRYANDSEPIAGATVQFYDASGAGVTPAATVTSGADGSYVVQNLPYGTYRVRAVGDPALYVPQWFSGQSAFVDAFDVVIGAGSHVPSVDVYLEKAPDVPTGYLSGRVIDGPTGQPLEGATVELFDADGDGVTPLASQLSDAAGGYAFPGLLPGDYVIRASYPGAVAGWYGGGSFDEATVFAVQPGSESTGLQIALWSTVNSVTGNVYDGATGLPVAGATVELYDATGDGTTPVLTLVTDAEGRYQADDLVAGDYAVRASGVGLVPLWYAGAADFATASPLTITAGQHLLSIDFHLWTGTRTMSGTVREWGTGLPVEGVEVRLYPFSPEDAPAAATTVTDADGRYEFVDFDPEGTFLVEFLPEGAAASWYYQSSSRALASALFSSEAVHFGGVDGWVGQPSYFDSEGTVTITGSPSPGQTLTAHTEGVFSPEPEALTYQWSADGIPIDGATGPTYVVTPADRGADITVTVVASRTGYEDAQSTSPPVFVAPYSLAEIAAALDLDEGMSISLFGGSRGLALSDAAFTGFPRAGGDYVVLSTGWASQVMLPAETSKFLSSSLNGGGVDGHDMTGITISSTAPAGSQCLAFDLKFGSEEFPEYVGSAFNDVFTAESPASDIRKQGSAIIAPNNYAFDTEGNIVSVNVVVGFAPVAGNAMDGWTPSLTARVPLGTGETPVILTLQDIGDSAYDSAVLLDNVRFIPTAECGGGGTTPTEPITGPAPVIQVDPIVPGSDPTPADDGVTACSVLSVLPGEWAPAPVDLTYQWKLDGVPVDGATGTTFPVPADAAGKVVTVVVTGSKVGYPPVSIASAPTPPVTLCEIVGAAPTIEGVPDVGESLSAVIEPEWGPAPVDVEYEWLRNGVPISGETLSTYIVSPSDAGQEISVRVTGSKPGYAQLALTSSALVIAGGLLDLAPAPVPTITGTAVVAGSLSVVTGIWGPAPVDLAIQWQRDGSPIPGAHGSSYTPTATDAGALITVVVSGSKDGYTSASRTSDPTGPVQLANLASGVPVLSGAATTCGILSLDTGSWGPPPVALTIRWFIDDVEVPGASTTTFPVPLTALGAEVKATVTGTKAGYQTSTETTDPVGPVIACTLITAVPIVTGTAVMDGELTVDPGVWGPAPVDLGLQWLRNGAPIPGAVGLTYHPTTEDVGTALRAAVTGMKAGYASATTTSTAVTIAAGALTPAPTPVISGSAVVDQTLLADLGVWGPMPVTLGIEWLRNGVTVSTAAQVALAPADVGATVALRVTASKPGYTTEVRTSFGLTVVAGQLSPAPTPTITGDPRVGQTLTAAPGVWGPAPVALGYQWSAEGVPIPGATASTWSVTTAYVGATITVTVTGSKAGYTTAGRTSAPTAAVQDAVLSPTPVPTISGVPVFGQTLTVSTGTWGPAPVTLGIEWLKGGVPIAGATGTSYAPVVADVGSDISVRVTGSKPGFPSVSRSSLAVTIQPATLTPTPTPQIVGTVAVGATLSASLGAWGPQPVDLAIEWLRNGSVVSTASSLTLTAGDVGATIAVRATGTKAGYTTAVRTSPGVTVAPGTLSPTPTPTITGLALIGQTLTAVPGTWGPAPVDLAYQWSSGGTPIAGATDATLILTSGQLGQAITVTVTGSKPGYTSASRTSAATAAVVNPVLSPTPVPTISGSPIVGQTLTAAPGTWGPAPVALGYQWRANNVAIPGATGTTWAVTAAYVGQTITVTVTGSKAGYPSVSRTSAPTAPVSNPVLAPTPVPTISGLPEVGRVLTAVPGTWGPAPVSLAYQWLRNGTPIPGANKSTYDVRTADLGARISVQVTGTKPGYAAVSRTSAETSPVTLQSWAVAPTPTISGTLKVGSTLTASPGSWSPAPGAFAYQWYADGVAIPLATGSTLALNGARAGDRITVAVTATGAGMQPTTRTSAPTAPIASGTLTIGDTPWITGTTTVGSTLRVHVGTGWGPTPVQATFIWKRDGAAIPGATGTSDFWTYKLTAADRGHRITVTVIFEKIGYTSVTRTTAQTAVVK